jgi:hypothetical protein
MASIERKDAMNMVAIMCAGIFANPAFGNVVANQYDRQLVIQQMIWDVQGAMQSAGIDIIELDEKIQQTGG